MNACGSCVGTCTAGSSCNEVRRGMLYIRVDVADIPGSLCNLVLSESITKKGKGPSANARIGCDVSLFPAAITFMTLRVHSPSISNNIVL